MSEKPKQFKIQLDPFQVHEAIMAYVESNGLGIVKSTMPTFGSRGFFPDCHSVEFTGFDVVIEIAVTPPDTTTKAKG